MQHAAKQRDQLHAMHAALREFSEGEGLRSAEKIQDLLGALKGMPMTCVPSPCGTHVQVQPASRDDVANCLAWAEEHAASSGLGPRLEKLWDAVHRPLLSGVGAEPPIVDLGREEQPPQACCKAGICLCSDEGKALRLRANKFASYCWRSSSSMALRSASSSSRG